VGSGRKDCESTSPPRGTLYRVEAAPASDTLTGKTTGRLGVWFRHDGRGPCEIGIGCSRSMRWVAMERRKRDRSRVETSRHDSHGERRRPAVSQAEGCLREMPAGMFRGGETLSPLPRVSHQWGPGRLRIAVSMHVLSDLGLQMGPAGSSKASRGARNRSAGV
jgi:hypothetical protein